MMQLELIVDRTAAPLADSYLSDRDSAMAAIVKYAGERFQTAARAFILKYLHENGETPGEVLTDRAHLAGIHPPGGLDDRAFGPVFMGLSRRGLIEKVASCQRRKGHGTNGGIVWRAVRGS